VIERMKHVGVYVSDLERSIVFYRDVLGLELAEKLAVSEDLQLAFMKVPGDDGVAVELVWGKSVSNRDGKVNHIAFQVHDIEEVLEGLKKAGVELENQVPRDILDGKMRVVFFRGPDGERLEMVES